MVAAPLARPRCSPGLWATDEKVPTLNMSFPSGRPRLTRTDMETEISPIVHAAVNP